MYCNHKLIPKVLHGIGIVILSMSQVIMMIEKRRKCKLEEKFILCMIMYLYFIQIFHIQKSLYIKKIS